MGLTHNNQIYVWGNYKYLCDTKQMKDSENPYLLPGMESAHIKDIACSYKYCSALNDKGEIFVWGNYINDKIKKQKKEEEDDDD